MTTKIGGWFKANVGKARSAFSKGSRATPEKTVKSRGSEMVRSSSLSLEDGPRPPSPIYNAIKAKAFNARWEKEWEWSAPRKTVNRPSVSFEEFNRSAGLNLQR